MEPWIKIGLLLQKPANLVQIFLVLNEILLEDFIVGFGLGSHVEVDDSEAQK